MAMQPTQKDVIDRTTDKLAAKKVYTPQEFAELFNKLCKETGYTIGAHPEFKLRDDNTFSVIVVMTIQKVEG